MVNKTAQRQAPMYTQYCLKISLSELKMDLKSITKRLEEAPLVEQHRLEKANKITVCRGDGAQAKV